MLKKWHVFGVTTLLLIAGIAIGQDVQPPAGAQEKTKDPQTAHQMGTAGDGLRYLLYLPPDYESESKWPLLLFLHGAGERGDDLDRVRVHGPPKLIAGGESFPFIVVSPQCPGEQNWKPKVLNALLDEIEAQYHVDPDRVYISGLSMGGFGTWSLLSYAPDRFAAAIPICGGGDPQSVKRFAQVPIWAFHGEEDQVVPVQRTKDMVEALEQSGSHVLLTIYADTGHDSWSKTYANPELFEWMLRQKRPSPDR